MSRIKNWFITQLCRTSLGFKVAYHLGLARPGIDFVDVEDPTAYDGFWILTPRALTAIEYDFKKREGDDVVVCPLLDPECFLGCDHFHPGCPFERN